MSALKKINAWQKANDTEAETGVETWRSTKTKASAVVILQKWPDHLKPDREKDMATMAEAVWASGIVGGARWLLSSTLKSGSVGEDCHASGR